MVPQLQNPFDLLIEVIRNNREPDGSLVMNNELTEVFLKWLVEVKRANAALSAFTAAADEYQARTIKTKGRNNE